MTGLHEGRVYSVQCQQIKAITQMLQMMLQKSFEKQILCAWIALEAAPNVERDAIDTTLGFMTFSNIHCKYAGIIYYIVDVDCLDWSMSQW